ncbi:MAG: DUF4091 domain-containing protein [Lentisphaerae bacterium]|nr:DUF4091 domain-containing protein [Lentisphaerota bacterium]
MKFAFSMVSSLILGILMASCISSKRIAYEVPCETKKAVVWATHPLQQVLGDKPHRDYDRDKLPGIELHAVRNEYENAQVIVSAKEDVRVSVSLSNLTHREVRNCIIPGDCGEIFVEKTIAIKKNWHRNGAPLGDYPDALIPLENANDFDLNVARKGRNLGFWISLKIPTDAKAGMYDGQVLVAMGDEVVHIPVSLRVYDITLPDRTTSRSHFNINANEVSHYELDSSKEMFDAYVQFLRSHRLSPIGLCGGIAKKQYASRDERLAEAAIEHVKAGGTTVGLPIVQQVKDGFKLIDPDQLANTIAFVTHEGYKCGLNLPKAFACYNYFIDEPFYTNQPDGRVEKMIEAYDLAIEKASKILLENKEFDPKSDLGKEIMEQIPKIPHIITDYFDDVNRYRPPLKNHDGTPFTYAGKKVALCPKFNGFTTAERRAQYDNGFERWCYTCNEPGHPYPSYHTDDILASPIAISWMMAEYGIQGNLMWVINLYGLSGVKVEDPYAEAHIGTGANGDGQLVYPGKLYGVYGPVATMRMKAILDGNEDFELLSMVKAALQKAGKDPIAGIHALNEGYCRDGQLVGGNHEYERARLKLLETMEALGIGK